MIAEEKPCFQEEPFTYEYFGTRNSLAHGRTLRRKLGLRETEEFLVPAQQEPLSWLSCLS